ncbi:hypothetical protein JL720_11211 [Aureococcus anophagefferens]|nr:hypothetical protein JL720_11211 [Aureococcus anophagefferens]
MEEPGEDEMSPMSAARRPERGPARRDDGRARRPVCKIFAYLAENASSRPCPWRCGGGEVGVAGGAPPARAEPEGRAADPDAEDRLARDAPEASPGTLASSAGPESAVADDELLRKLRAAARLEAGRPTLESQAPIPEGGAADGDATGFAVSCSVQCDGAACVAPAGAAHTCLSSTLDDAFAVPSMTAACLFGLDRLEDEVPRARVAEARPAAAKEAAPVDDGDLVVPEMGEWVESLVGDLDARLEPTDVEPLASGPGRGATASPHLSLASLVSRGISRAKFAARQATSRRTLCSDSSKTTVFIANVERVVVKRLGRAARWHAELEAADDARAKERAAVAYLRAEMLSKKERTVMTTIAERLQGELEAPEEPPGAAPYIAAWAGVLCVVLYCFYYLLTTGSQFGRKKTRLWLEAVTFSLVLYFVFIKPIVVLLISVIMPSFVASSVDKARSPLDHPRYPFETPLPESSVFYLLRWHPELAGTRLADHDTLIEEVFTFLPLASGFVAERTPGLESAGEDVGAAFGMVVVGALVYVAWKAYHACGKATARAAVALPRRKSDAGGPAFRWPEDEAPETPRPDVAGEDEKSPEDAVALVLFDDDGGDGDRVEAVRPDDDEAAAERPDDAASGGSPETLSDYVFSVQAKPEDAPVPSYSDAAYAAAKGAVVAGGALDSDKVLSLPAGTAVVVEVAEQLPDKKTRYLLVEPVVGWVSRGAVAKAR